MSYIILPSRRTRQPQGATRLASRFESSGSTFLWNAAHPRMNCANGVPVTITSNSSSPSVVSPMGRGWQFTASGGVQAYAETAASAAGGSGVTIVAQVSGLLYGNSGLAYAGVPGVRGFSLTFGDSYNGFGERPIEYVGVTSIGIADYSFTTSGPKPIERPVTIVVTHNAQRACLSMNGSPVQTITTGGYTPWNAGDAMRLGNTGQEGFNIFYGFRTMGGILPYAVADSDLPSLSANPWQLFAPDPRRLYFGAGATGGGTDALTADGLTSSAPTQGTPTLTGTHVLTGVGLTSSAPTLSEPTLAGTHVLTGVALTSGAPTLGEPTLSENSADHNLAADGLASGAPTLGTPTLAQLHAFTAAGLLGASPILSSPAFGQVHLLTADGIISGVSTLGEPTLVEAGHALAADGLLLGAPTLGEPTLTVEGGIAPGPIPSFASGGGGGASVRKWMKESGLDDEIDQMAEKLGLKLDKKKKVQPPVLKEVKQTITKKVEQVVAEVVAETVADAATSTITREEFRLLEKCLEELEKKVDVVMRIDQMETKVLKQMKRNEEEYYLWRAMAEKVI